MSTNSIRPKKRWPIVLAGVFLLLIAAYFVLTSAFFVRAVVLPKVAAALNSDLVVDDLSLSPFSSLELSGVKLTPKGADTLLSVSRVKAHYSLMSIIGGDIKVDEVTLDTPDITLITKADGTSNLDPITKGSGQAKPSQPSGAPSKPLKLTIRAVAIRNASVHLRQAQTNGTVAVVDVTGFNLAVDSVQNGGTSKIDIGAQVKVDRPGQGALTATLAGTFSASLDAALIPTAANGSLKLDVTQASGGFKDLAAASINLLVDATPSEIKQLELSFLQGRNPFGKVRLSGPFNQATKEARIDYVITGIDRRALQLALVGSPLDLGNTTISATGRVDRAGRGDVVASRGLWTITSLSMVSTNGTTPPVDLSIDYQVSANLNDKNALLEKLTILGTKKGAALLTANVERPMNFAWGTSSPGFRESTFGLKLTNFNLAEWKAVLGPTAPSGQVGVDFTLTADNNGKMLKGTLAADVSKVAGKFGTYELHQAGVKLDTTFTIEAMNDFASPKFTATVQENGKQLLTVSGNGSYQIKTGRAGLQATTDISLPDVTATFPVPGLKANAGTIRLNLQADLDGPKTNASVALQLQGFTGTFNQFEFHDYQAKLNVVAGAAPGVLTLSRCTLNAQTGFNDGGLFDLSAKYDTQQQTAQVDFKTVNLNENALGPIVAAFVQPNQLVSVSLDTSGNANWAKGKSASVHTDLKVSRLMARGPHGPVTDKPLELGLAIDGSQTGTKIDLQKVLLRLGATAVAKNELQVTGSIDLGTNSPAPSSLSIKSDGLDLTPWADLLGMGATNAPTKAAKPTADSGPAKPAQEPAPINLPFKKFDLSLDIAKVHLRQLDVTGWTGKVGIDNGKVTVNPFAMNIAGAPFNLTTEADLTVPGYKYKSAILAKDIPLAPLVDTFVADMRGSASGFATIDLKADGQGITPPSLRKTLSSALVVTTTNLVVQIPKTKVHLPIFGESDLTGPLRFVATVLGLGDVLVEPVRVLQVNAVTKDGRVDLAGTRVASAAFKLEPTGGVTLSDVITNSPVNVPLAFYLGPSGAKHLSLTTDASGYGKLPDFAMIGGTVGKTVTKLNELALFGLGIRGAVNLPGNLGGNVIDALKGTGSKSSNVVQGLNRLISTNSANTNNVVGGLLKGLGFGANTNAAGTNASPKPFNPLDLFKKK